MIAQNTKNYLTIDCEYALRNYTKYISGIQQIRNFGLDLFSLKDIYKINKNTLLIRDFIFLLMNDQITRLVQLLDVVSIDRLNKIERFQVCYNLLNNVSEQATRVIIRIDLYDKESIISLSSIFPSANWLERECWDLMGILFTDHSDLRRILTNYGFIGHPLRKDFPAVGFVQVRYDELTKSVIEEPVSLTQEYRFFDFLSPWENSNENRV